MRQAQDLVQVAMQVDYYSASGLTVCSTVCEADTYIFDITMFVMSSRLLWSSTNITKSNCSGACGSGYYSVSGAIVYSNIVNFNIVKF